MSEPKARKLSNGETLEVFRDARVASIRWDLVTWSLVFDLDAPDSERADPDYYRAWLVFDGVDEITIPFNGTRLPLGFWLHSEIVVATTEDEKISSYRFNAQLPVFEDKTTPSSVINQEISVNAMKVLGVISTNSMKANEFGILEPLQRRLIATDEEMPSALLS